MNQSQKSTKKNKTATYLIKKNRSKLNLRNSMDLSICNGNTDIKKIKNKLIRDNFTNNKKTNKRGSSKTDLDLKINGSMSNLNLTQNNNDRNEITPIRQINQKKSSFINMNKNNSNMTFLEFYDNTNDTSNNNNNFDINKHLQSFSNSFQRNASRKSSTKSNTNAYSAKNLFMRKGSRTSSFKNPGSSKIVSRAKSLIINTKYLSKLHGKEKSYYLLAHSPVLRLCERMVFARCTNNMKVMITMSELLKNNSIFLEDKVNELEKKLKFCNENITLKFKASKISEITLNCLVSSEEEEFKKYFFCIEDESSRKDYYLYLKILFYLFNEKPDGIEDKYLKNKLYEKIEAKGFKSIKEYLYQLYIKDKVENHILENIDAIDEILEQNPNILAFNYFLKINRFISFTTYLINEVISYANYMKNNMILKVETQKLLEVVQAKLEHYKNEYSKK